MLLRFEGRKSWSGGRSCCRQLLRSSIDFVEELPDVEPGRKDFIKFVNDKETKEKWQQGKKPKRSE